MTAKISMRLGTPAMDLEIQNFLTKFRSMACAGFKAQLNITSEVNEVCVSLNVNLGSIPPSSVQEPVSINRHRPPSYYRRQAKRKSQKIQNNVNRTCAAEKQAADSPTECSDAEIASNVEVETAEVSCELADSGSEPVVIEFEGAIAQKQLPLSFSKALDLAEVKQADVCRADVHISSSNYEQPLREMSSGSLSSRLQQENQELCCVHVHTRWKMLPPSLPSELVQRAKSEVVQRV